MLELLQLILFLILIFFLVELLTQKIIFYVNKKFQWLITSKDEEPALSDEGLKKFLIHGYDHELGWIRKPNTSHAEKGKYGTTRWTINSIEARTNPQFDNLESLLSCYGDSFTFCRQVNDDETWEHYLSKLLNTNVQNFGVGNYGIDQSLLRLKREYHKNKTKFVILAVVPDTISRITSIWKHYYEYGNTFGFKPRFELKDDQLVLIKNPIDHESKFYKYREFLDEIQKNDFFYKQKFKEEKLHFPYSVTIFKNCTRNFSIIYWILRYYISKNPKYKETIAWNPMQIIMNINLKWRLHLYKNSESTLLLYKIIEEYVFYSRQNNFTPIFIFLPQKDDVLFIKKNYHFYNEFQNKIKKIVGLYVIDVTKDLLNESDLDSLYSDNNNYGGHFSKEGNQKISNIIFNELTTLIK